MRFPDIVTPYPLAFLLLCLLAGFAVAFLLYYREKRSEIPSKRRLIAGIIRFILYSLTAFLLMQPLIQSIKKEKEKPIIAVLLDNSQSMQMGKVKNEGWDASLKKALTSLGSGYDVKYYRFDDEVAEFDSLSRQGYRTDISNALEFIDGTLRNRNLGAIILASDGIYNAGSDPLMAAEALQVPIFSMALGDSNQYADVRVARVEANRIAFLGNNFPLRVHTRSQGEKGSSLRLEVRRDGKLLYSKLIQVTEDDHYTLENITLDADRPGLNKYVISLSAMQNEINTANNRQAVYIEVLDSRKKILILAAAPHPDISALRQAFASKQQILTEVLFLPAAIPDLKSYDMAVLYQLPSAKYDATQLTADLRKASLPVLFCLGTQTDVRLFDALNLGIKVAGPAAKFNDVLPVNNPRFTLFRPEERTLALLSNLDPLQVPFGEFTVAADLQTLLYQRIGKISSDKPLLSFHDQQGWKTAILTGEGIWRWRLAMYQETGTHQWFDNLMAMTVQYLAISEKKGRFRVEWPNILLQSDPVITRAEVYNASYQPEGGKEIDLELRDSAGNRFNYVYAENGDAYSLNLGYLKPGKYSYRASVRDMTDLKPVNGSFEVEELNVESMVLQANHRMLASMSALRDAKMLYPNQVDQLPELIKAREDIRPLVFVNKRYTDLSQWPVYLVIILLLLAAEWLIRRLSGAY